MAASINEELLIEAVRRFPQLYDQKNKSYYDVTVTRNAWDSIAEILNCSGAIFTQDQRNSSLETAFKYAIDNINRDRNLLPRTKLMYDIQYVPKDDIFHASKTTCHQIQQIGVRGIFGPSDPVLGAHVHSICDALDIPHLEARHDLERDRKESSINLYPDLKLLNHAFQDVMNFLNWTKVAIIYEQDYGLLKLRELVKSQKKSNFEIYLRQAEPSNYRSILKDVKNKDIRNVIVDTGPQHMDLLLKSILQLQMNDYTYHYLFTSFDIETFDLEDFRYNFVNMTAFRLVDFDNSTIRDVIRQMELFGKSGRGITYKNGVIKTEAALLFDAVHAYAVGLQTLELSHAVEMNNASCDSEVPWAGGLSLINYINSVDMSGLSGPIEFKEGRRTQFKLDLLKLKGPELKKVGVWSPTSGVKVFDFSAFFDESPTNISLVVMTILEEPYVMRRADSVIGSDLYEGFCIDLLKRIAEMVGFEYTIKLVPDGKYGAIDPNTGEWNGIVRQLIDKKADLAVGSMTINYARENVIDFTKPFMNLGISILFKVPTDKESKFFTFFRPLDLEIWMLIISSSIFTSVALVIISRLSPYEWVNPRPWQDPTILVNRYTFLNSMWFVIGTLLRQNSGIDPKVPMIQEAQYFSFMKPLSNELWWSILGAYVLVSLSIWLVARISPYERHRYPPCAIEGGVLRNNFTIGNSFWFAIGTLMQQGSDVNPESVSTRIVGGIWWFFTLIIIASYTANLAAFLTVERMITPVENAEDLAAQTDIVYGTLESGSTMTFFRDSMIETYKKMWRFMESRKPSAFVPTYKEGIRRVMEGNYAFIMESCMLEYEVQRNCKLTQIGGLLDSKGYGIATPMGSPWRDKISLAILELQEKGEMQMLYDKWWKNTGDICSRKEKGKGSKANALGVHNIGGVFILLLAGLAVGVAFGFIEFCVGRCKNRNQQPTQQSLTAEMMDELCFAMRCCGSRRKPALRRQCSKCCSNVTHEQSTELELPPPPPTPRRRIVTIHSSEHVSVDAEIETVKIQRSVSLPALMDATPLPALTYE